MEIKKTRTFLFVLLFIGGGLIFSFLLFSWLRQGELNIAKEKFSHRVYHYSSAIEYALVDETHLLNTLAAYHDVAEFISRDEFKKFSKKTLKMHPNVQAVVWIPEVLDKDRELYEKSAQQEGLESFSFKELDENGTVVFAQVRPIYYPIYFLKPLKGNEKALGSDIGFEKKLFDTMLKAKESGVLVASEPVNLPQVSKQELGIAVFQPMYKSDEDKNSFQGFYAIVIRIEHLVEESIAKIADKRLGVNFKVYDAEFSDKVIYEKKCSCEKDDMLDVKAKEIIEFGGRKFVVEAYASKIFTKLYLTPYPYIIVTILILLIVFISWVFYLMQKRYTVISVANEQMRRFQKLAVTRESRIAELKQENQELKKLKETEHE